MLRSRSRAASGTKLFSQQAREWKGDQSLTHERAARHIATYTPVHYEPGYSYPLIVWLHGENHSEQDLCGVMRHVSLRNYVAIAPRAPYLAKSNTLGSIWSPSPQDSCDAEEAVMESIDIAARRFSVNRNKVFLAGIGAGGTTALRLALMYPTRFAGVASLDGGMPRGGRPFRSLSESRGLPILLSVGLQSSRYSQFDVCRDLRLLHSAGARLDVRQYPGADELTTLMLRDLDAWIMALVCGSKSRSS